MSNDVNSDIHDGMKMTKRTLNYIDAFQGRIFRYLNGFESDCPHEFPLNVLIRVAQREQ